MHLPSRSNSHCLGLVLGLAVLFFSTAAMAQGALAAPPVQARQVDDSLQALCAGTPCSPPELAARYRVTEGNYAGSELRLDADSRYLLTLEMSVMLRRFSGQWQLDGGMVLLQPDAAPGASVQLLSDGEVNEASKGMRALLEDLESSASSPAEQAELQALRAELEGKRSSGAPVFVALSDPMSGVAAEGVRVELELRGGAVLLGEEVAGNDYRFTLPDDAVKVQGMVLHFPGLAEPVRLPLDGPLRPRYAVLFDACDVGSCHSDTMMLVPDQRGGEWVMDGLAVGVFVRTDAGSAK